jgi:adenine-specific DNA-methyltransferase
MNTILLEPRKALNTAFLKIKPNRTHIESFKTNLIKILDSINEKESEEFHKNLVIDFLKKTYYDPNYSVNTKGRNDLVIHNGKDAKTNVGVIIEAKSPINKTEMITVANLNGKALQELVLYYMRERITHKNTELKHLVVTNIHEWFVFDAQLFNKLFAENKPFAKQFIDFEEGRLSGKTTDYFYKEIAKPFIEALQSNIEFAHFDIRKYDKPLRNADKEDDKSLVALFKLLSPEHLLKLSFANDSNSLDKNFYSELLHIIGLTEVKEGGKKLIERHKQGKRNSGSLLENAIEQLDSLDKISRLQNPKQYGDTNEERLFTVALELTITWVNRILFLKLLEAQLITYHKGDKSYSFLNSHLIKDYDNLNSLFFQVLAKKPEDRNERVFTDFAKVPYLNSSLFEPTDLEHETLFISQLEDNNTLPLLPATVIKDNQGKKNTGTKKALDYFFSFLDAYDFASEGSEDIQEDNKTLINASVLGLIFEKINGYKDGSFFTPSFITMYMCKETIRRAVVQKFNETKNWDCNDFDSLYDKIEDRKEANEIINSLKICDPAVGSGHFLVSALNEIIAIKNDLRVLQDHNGNRLKEYHFEVINDELIVTDEDAIPFSYNPKNKESQRIQETLFHEKQTIIENCLFGVDINPNSVKICRLRLWIELLKNAYYKTNSNELETLPNIDINIKCGNSLISRFGLDADLKKALKQSKWNIESYKLAVSTYRNAESKEQKREMERLIGDIKSNFRSEIGTNDPKKLKLEKLKGELFNYTQQVGLFERSKKEQTEWNKKVNVLGTDIKTLDTEIEEIKSNKIYENAFEWRFEFPDVLNDEGDFVGFDVVIGNPPYLRVRENNNISKNYYFENYRVSENQLDLYHLFIERTNSILNKCGVSSLIIPNSFLGNHNNQNLRNFILDNYRINKIININEGVFEEASVEVIIFLFEKSNREINYKSDYLQLKNGCFNFSNHFDANLFHQNIKLIFTVTLGLETNSIIQKIKENSIELSDLFDTISGIKEYQIGKGKPKQNPQQVKDKVFNSKIKKDDTYLPELRGKNLSKYNYNWENEYISYGTWLAEPRVPSFFEGQKILIRQIPGKKSLIASYVSANYVVDQTAYIAKPKKDLNIDLFFYLGILNSSLLFWYFRNMNNEFDLLFPKIKVKEFNSLPLLKIEKNDPRLKDKVNEILSLKSQDPKADTAVLEQEIDTMVYELYGLTEEEIKIVEGIQ